MKRFNLHHLGRFGNQMFGYAFARGYCERHGLELHTDPWVGERIFDLSHPRCTDDLPRRDEFTLVDGEGDVSYRSYSQNQKCADYYTTSQCRNWFKINQDVHRTLNALDIAYYVPHAHLRRTDYAPLGYPVVSNKSVYDALSELTGNTNSDLVWVSDELPGNSIHFTGELDFLPDFYRLMKAPIMFRANSSFSFWAGVLNHGRVFSPIIDGLAGGIEHDVEYVEGNWPRISNHDFVSEIRLAP